jgi:nucleotide-binding universal stress UspA family protein
MMPFKKILVPTDLSECSFRAFWAARQMAACSAANIVVLHVVDKLPVSPKNSTELSSSVEEAETGLMPFDVTKRLEELMTQAQDTMEEKVGDWAAEKEKVRLEVREGYAPVEIIEGAAEMGADLIVMAARGRGAPDRRDAGSITQEVVRGASTWVLTVR